MNKEENVVIAQNDYIKTFQDIEIYYRDSLRSHFNRCIISGTILYEFRYSHTGSNGEEFFQNVVVVKNVDGRKNYIPIIVPEHLALKYDCFMVGKYVRIGGQFRSFKNDQHLQLFLFANEIELFKFPKDEDFNSIFLKGTIQKYLNRFTLQYGVTNIDLILKVSRNYNKEDYIPCTMSAPSASVFNYLKLGTEIVVEGWIRSRLIKNSAKRNVYEIVMSEVKLS